MSMRPLPPLARLCLLALTIGATSCKKVPPGDAAAEPSSTGSAPAGEISLTPAQISDAQIGVSAVDLREVDDTILTSGTVTLDDLHAGHVFSPVTGRVVSILAQLGERVHKGQALAAIESPDVGSAVSDVHKAEADLIAAEHALKRQKTLYEQKAGPASDLEAAEDTYRKAKAEVERAREKQSLLSVGSVDTVTQTYTLRSPIDGEVLLRNINPGIEVTGQYSSGAAQELFTIGDVDRVWVLGDVYEMDLARVHVGSPAAVTVVAQPGKTFTGTVDWVSGALDPTTRTARVRCTFDNPDKLLRPMMYATVQISVDRKQALAIPRDALLRLGQEKVVFVQTGDSGGSVQFRRVAVDVDEGQASAWLEVKHGLERGQKVVTSGAILLSAML
jgi:cobalt-zinc-cadmium efflux system membrane fusion protein